MAVQVTRRWSGEDVERDPNDRTAVAIFDVRGVDSSAEAETAVDATTALTIPVQNESFVDRGGTTYDKLKAASIISRTTGFGLFTVTVNYSIPADGDSHTGTGIDDDPLLAPTQYVWELGLSQEPIEFDINDAAIVNSAGDAPEQPVLKAFSTVFLNVTRNEATFDASLALTYLNKVNSNGAFFGADAGQSKCVGITSPSVATENATFYQVRYRFEFRADGFKLKLINRGFNMLLGGELVRIVEGDTHTATIATSQRPNTPQVTRPRLLDNDGTLRNPASDPIILEFDLYETADFSALNL